jgi:membrane-bound lytic murein transglycosylase D
MPPTPAKAHALSFAILLGTAACASTPHAPAAPVPVAAPAQPAQAPEQIQEPFAITSAPSGPVRGNLLGNVRYDLPVEANRWVEMELDFLVGQRRAVIGRWLERAGTYETFVQETFASYGIPRDLHHLAMVESGYSPTARSHAGAVGMWQFMTGTGRGMGLRIDDVVDERMDPVRSTHAAARHLRQLHREFRGDWALAAAAYNAGSGRINRGLGRFGASNFWELAERGDLAQETRHYVPRLYAVTIIGRDRARFGYPVPGPARGFRPDSIRVDVETPVAELARIASLDVTRLTELNPHLHRGIAPANYWVWAPAGSGSALQAAFDTSSFRRAGGYGWYTLRAGEDVAQLAAAAGIPVERIRELNLSTPLERLGRGDRVRLPAQAARTLAARPVPVERGRLASASDEPRGPSTPEMDAARAEARRAREARRDEERLREARRAEEERLREARRAEEREARRAEEREAAARRLAARQAEAEAKEEERSTRRAAASADAASTAPDEAKPSTAERPSRTQSDTPRTRRALPDSSRPRRTADADSSERPSTRRAERRDSTSRPTATRGERADSATRTASRRGERGDSTTRTAARRDSTTRTAARRDSTSPRRTEERAESRARTHTVAAGETLRAIAEKYDVTPAQLRAANDIPSGKGVEVGQRLRLPRAEGSSAPLAVASERAARARSGDEPRPRGEAARDSARPRERPSSTPSRRDSTEKRATRADSASRTRTTERRTTARDSASTRTGAATVEAKPGAARARPASEASTRPRTTPDADKGQAARPSQHTVKAGETLYGIARQYGVGVDALREANGMDAGNTIQPGQKLRIPRG